MVKYFVIYCKSNSNIILSKVFIESNDSDCYNKAKEFADSIKRNRYDVVIVKDDNKTNGDISLYEIKDYGFYKVYKVIHNSLIFILLFGIIFYYLYNKFN
jgi:hypothetical protein